MFNWSFNYVRPDDHPTSSKTAPSYPSQKRKVLFDDKKEDEEDTTNFGQGIPLKPIDAIAASVLVDYRWPLGSPLAKDYFVQEHLAAFLG